MRIGLLCPYLILFLLANSAWAEGGEDCAHATVIPALPYNDADTLGLTDDCVNRPFNDVFYTYTAAQAGAYIFDLCDSPGDTYLRIWLEGACCGGYANFADIGCGDDPRLTVELTQGQVIYIELGIWAQTTTPSPYTFHAVLARPGETCSAPRVVASLPYEVSDTLGYVDNCAGRPYNDIFYRFDVPATAIYNLDMCGSESDTYFRVWLDGTCCAGGRVNVDGGCSNDPRTSLVLTQGQTVYIECGASSSLTNPTAYTFRLHAAPAAELCSTAVVVNEVPFASSGVFGDADNCAGQPYNDLFFRFTAVTPGNYTFDLCGSEDRTALRLWLSDSCCAGTSLLAVHACDDMDVTQTVLLDAGQTVYAECGTWANQTLPPDYVFHVRRTPAGENCEAPLILPALPATVTGSTGSFGHDLDAVCPASGGTARDVVYEYIAGANVCLNLSLCRSAAFNTKLYVFADSCTGTPIACSDDAYPCPGAGGMVQSFIESLFLLGYHNYFIVVDGHSLADSGSYMLEVEECHAQCEIVCPPGTRFEGELDCYDGYADFLNGGCDWNPHTFSEIACGDMVCGSSGTYHALNQSQRESDWYRLLLAEPSHIGWSAWGELPIELSIIRPDPGGGCDAAEVIASATTWEWHCDTVRVDACLVPGTYWLRLRPPYTTGVFCGLDYLTWLSCEPCTPLYCDCAIAPQAYHNDTLRTISWPDTAEVPVALTMLLPVTDLNVCLDLAAAPDSSVSLFLRAPYGVRTTLCSRNGGAGANYACTLFDDEAMDSVTTGAAPFTGSFVPLAPLSVFDGLSGSGTWYLEVVLHDSTMSPATLHGVSLLFEFQEPQCLPVTDFVILADSLGNMELHFATPSPGMYRIWSSLFPDNDGNPDGGNDGQWTLVAELEYPFGPVYYPLGAPAARYQNYVVTQVCN